MIPVVYLNTPGAQTRPHPRPVVLGLNKNRIVDRDLKLIIPWAADGPVPIDPRTGPIIIISKMM